MVSVIGVSEAKLNMGTEAHELQRVVVGFAVDQHEVGADVAVAVIPPLPCKGVILLTGGRGVSAASMLMSSVSKTSSRLPR
jgi:hypothetical protein